MGDRSDTLRDAANRVLEFADEVEASGDVSITIDKLDAAKAVLHDWVDQATGVVVMAAFGRVTLFHPSGGESSISSPELPFLMSLPKRAD